MKSEVKSLASTLEIDDRILSAPSDRWIWDDNRTDEKQLGLSYDDLEDAMQDQSSVNKDKYQSIRESNLHKMKPIPVCKIPNN